MLNMRQTALLEFLESQHGAPVRQEDIANALPLLYPWDGFGDFHASTARKIMTEDAREISTSDETHRVILSTRKGLKIATEGECERHIASEGKEIFRKIKRWRKKISKCNLDGQGMFGTDGVEFIEALMPKGAGA